MSGEPQPVDPVEAEIAYDQLMAIPEGGWGMTLHGFAVRPPGTPRAAYVNRHEITFHDDDTVTLHPSVEYGIPGEPYYYHGWLQHGIWTSV